MVLYNKLTRNDWATGDFTLYFNAVSYHLDVDKTYAVLGTSLNNGTGSDNIRTIDGVETVTADAAFTPTGALTIGSAGTTANRVFDGDMYEIIEYNDALTSTQMQQVNSYLAWKYAISMASTVDYLMSDGATTFWDVSAHAGYLNNVFGIGTDWGNPVRSLRS